MSITRDYTFYNQDRLGDDATCESQRSAQSSRYDAYMHSNFFKEFGSDAQIQFATSLPAVVPNGLSHGSGLGMNVDVDSMLLLKTEQERNLGRLQLMQRPFASVPFLGRGSCDPVIESQLMQGDAVGDKKSVSTIMSQSFMGYTLQPSAEQPDPKYTVEEAALEGWVRGGADTRATTGNLYNSGANSSKAY
jgi:hypothetical protein